jgi:hypothetical protein
VKGRPRQDVPAVVLEFTTPGFGWVRGKEYRESLAHTPLYEKALAARGKPAAPAPVKAIDAAVHPVQFVRPGAAVDLLQPDPGVPKTPPGPGVPPPGPEPAATVTTVTPVPLADERTVWISPRTNRPFTMLPFKKGNETTYVITGGIKLLAKFTTGSIRSLEVEADNAVIWRTEGEDGGPAFDNMFSEGGSAGADGTELYLTGNVVIRYGAVEDVTPRGVQRQSRTLRADRVYYDVTKHKAIAIGVDLEYTREGYANAGHLMADELHQLSSTEFTALLASVHASRLPSDPGFLITMDRADVYQEPRGARRNVFGTEFRDRLTGRVVEETPTILEATDTQMIVEDVPVFYWPFLRTNLADPLGPLENLSFRQDRRFGFQTFVTWDALDLLGLVPLDGERWTVLTDYLTRRGPAVGTNYSLKSDTFFGMDAPFQTLVKGYMIYDEGTDLLSGARQEDFRPPALRGRFLFRHQQDFEDLTVQAQVAYLSDRNFLEQYYRWERETGPNQETFVWLRYQMGHAAATCLVQPDLGRSWETETYWLPRLDGFLLGQSLFERFTYHSWASIAYAQLDPFRQPAREFPFGVDQGFPPPEVAVDMGRVDWMQQLSAPFDLGPARVVPYGVLDLAYYTQNNLGEEQGRIYGGGGVRASVPLSQLYPDVESELFNLKGLYHKNQFRVNYFIAGSSVSALLLPQLDRLNDDAVESAWRNVIPWEPYFPQTQGSNGNALAAGSYDRFNPRRYAIRRLVDSKPDTLDDIHEVQLGWRQRWQTKRGYPGLEHTVDWLTLDLSASVFPAADRDNFGSPVGFLEYHLVWNVGDQTGLFSSAWVDPFDFGARFFEVGTYFFRDDRTVFNFGYRHTDPLESRVVSVSATYVFSPKYAVTAATAYDLGYSSALTQSLYFTRVGTDLAVTVGFSYNSLDQNFGLALSVVPNLLASQTSPVPLQGPGALGNRSQGQTR